MKDIIISAIWLVGSFGLIITAAVMAIKGVDGWGWFLIAGICLATSFSYSDNNKNNEEED